MQIDCTQLYNVWSNSLFCVCEAFCMLRWNLKFNFYHCREDVNLLLLTLMAVQLFLPMIILHVFMKSTHQVPVKLYPGRRSGKILVHTACLHLQHWVIEMLDSKIVIGCNSNISWEIDQRILSSLLAKDYTLACEILRAHQLYPQLG